MFNDENTNGFDENLDNKSENNGFNQYDSNKVEENDSSQAQDTTEENTSGQNYNNSYYTNNNQYDNSYYNQYQNQYGANSNKPPRKKQTNSEVEISVVVVAVAILIMGVLVTVGAVYDNIDSGVIDRIAENSNSSKDSKNSTDTTNISNTTPGSVVVTDVSGVVEGAMPSVVAITSKTLVESNDYENQIYNYFFGGGNGQEKGDNAYEQEAAGSGIIIDQTDTELLIVTNNHVVEGADSLKIQFDGEDTESAVDGYLKGTDSNADIAVVAVQLKDISSDTLNNIKKATIGDSDSAKVGEGVIAIGNALGYGQSVTTGVISAKDREAVIEDKTMKLLQTDAAINGGNSGGALLNAKGEVIGINVAKYSSNGSATSASVEGMGFAIPISSVKSIIGELETKETRAKVDENEQGYLGIRGQDVPDDASEQYGIPKGAYVYQVTENGPAAKAGIAQYDVITKFDGQTVESMSALTNMMQYYKAGEKIKVTISYRDGRDYKEKEVTVTLGSKEVISDLESSSTRND